MKILKKINKGLILTIIVLLVLIIYLTGVEKQREADKEDIKKTCEDFIAFTDKFLVYPEEMQNVGQELTEKEEKEYLETLRTELEKLMIQNTEAVNLQYMRLKSDLRQGYSTSEIRTRLKTSIKKISSYKFDGDQVTVKFSAKVEMASKYLQATYGNEEKEQIKQNSFETPYDEITLRKVDGKWKVVYSDLQYNANGMYYTDSLTIY